MQTADTPENWGKASRGYATKIAPVLMRSFSETLLEMLDVDASTELIEVGAGSGAFSEVAYAQVKSLLATDFAPAMVEVLRERLSGFGAQNARCEVMDGQALEVEDEAFDRAAAVFAIMLFPDRARGFSELSRVLRSGGRAIVSAWTGPEKFQLFGLLIQAIREAFPDLPPPPGPPPVFSLADPERFEAEMEAGGFKDVAVEFVTRELSVPNVDDLWEMLTSGAPPVQMLLEQVGADGKDKLRGQLAQIVSQRFGDGPIVTANTATVAVGVKP